MLIKLIAKAATTGIVVYAVMETLDRLKVAQRVTEGVQSVGDVVASAISVLTPDDAE